MFDVALGLCFLAMIVCPCVLAVHVDVHEDETVDS